MPAEKSSAVATRPLPGERIFVALGGNLGDVEQTMHDVLRDIDDWPHTRVVARSALYRTEPVDAEGPAFVNAVVELRSSLEPQALLDALLALEVAHGRRGGHHRGDRLDDRHREAPPGAPDDKPRDLEQHDLEQHDLEPRRAEPTYAARPIDLDVLLIGNRHIDTPRLRVPHPRLHERAFVLAPLADLAPQLRLAQGMTVEQALAAAPALRVVRLGAFDPRRSAQDR